MTYRLSTDFMNGAVTRVLLLFDRPSYVILFAHCARYVDVILMFNTSIFCGCTARFVSDLIGNPEDRFSQNEAHMWNGNHVNVIACACIHLD